MDRKAIYEIGSYGDKSYMGWFNLDKAIRLAYLKEGNPYTTYTELYITSGKKLVICESNNHGMDDTYRFCTAKEASELCAIVGDPDHEEIIKEICKDFEIK